MRNKSKDIDKEKIAEDKDKAIEKENEIVEEKIIEEKKESTENTNEDSANNSGGGGGLGFFGRLMAPIFLTETEINKIKGK